ncbi:MAG TPA: LON peptidase substrate-binding domain-containing protein, partial [Candidatus Polarisedimenticolia bacterium]|nr:LON peptidase substrate-binding domain-containing protein [Candidatus Polarisedimenticolia bacterium]
MSEQSDDAAPTILAEDVSQGSGRSSGKGDAPAIPGSLPILPLKNTVVFPHIPMPLVIGRTASMRLIDEAMVKDRIIGLAAQKSAGVEEPKPDDLHRVGTAAVIQRLLKFPDGTIRVLVNGLQRIRWTRVIRQEPYLVADVEVLEETLAPSVEIEALTKNLMNLIGRMLALMPIASDELAVALLNVEDPARLTDMAATLLVRDTALKQEYLETVSVAERLRKLTRQISRDIEVMELGSKIQKQVQDEM